MLLGLVVGILLANSCKKEREQGGGWKGLDGWEWVSEIRN